MKKKELLRKVMNENYTTSDRVARALAIEENKNIKEISSGEGEKRYSIKRRSDKRRTVNPVIRKDGFTCSCEDYLSRKVMCKHVIAAFLREIDYFEAFVKGGEGKEKAQTMLKTGISNLDQLTGGIPVGSPCGIYGMPNTGKSFMCYQIAALASSKLGKPAVYFDTEGFFNDQTRDKFSKYFRRYEGKKIDFFTQRSLKKVGQLLGLEIELSGDKRIDAMINHQETIPVEKTIRMFDYRILVIDSLTSPVKERIPTPPTQNLPARASVFSSIVGVLSFLAEKYNLLTMITFHRSQNPTKPWQGSRPYGGSNILYNTKYLLNLRYPTKDERKDLEKEEELRKFVIDRWAGEKSDSTVLRLAEDTGYVDP